MSGPYGSHQGWAEWGQGWPELSVCGCVGGLLEAGWEAPWLGLGDQSVWWAQDQRRWRWVAGATEPGEEMEVHGRVAKAQRICSQELLRLSCPHCYLL